MHICRYFHDESLPSDIREILEERMHRALFESSASGNAEGALARTIDRIAGTITVGEFTTSNARLSERLAHEAVHWAGSRWAELERDDPFVEEEREVDAATKRPVDSAEALSRLFSAATGRRPELRALARLVEEPSLAHHDEGVPSPRATDNVDAPSSRHDEIVAHIDRNARASLVIRRWRDRLEAQRDEHRANLLGRALGGFVRELNDLVPLLAREQEVVRDALGNEDALWDLDRHEWEELPLEGITDAADMLEQHPEIERLAHILGRSRTVTERRTVERVERMVRLRPVGIGKSEVTGIRAGDDLSSLVTSEVALLARPETEELFYAKLAHRELLVLDYNRQRLVELVTKRRVSTSAEVSVDRGPAIVCVDTSGSMLGLPERVAKATVLALAKRLAADRRRVEVIAFASDVRSFTLDHANTNLPDLARFLAGGFHGGTDLRRALAEALDRLSSNDYRHADVLVISDFRVPKIADRFLEMITAQHRRGTLFHSLTVARRPVTDPLHIFDASWLFSTESGRIAGESLRSLG